MKLVMRLIIAFALALSALSAHATYTAKDVDAAVRAGKTAEAEAMMRSVVRDKPQSARAHYMLAETLHLNAKDSEAREEAQRARDLDPAIGFTNHKRFDDFVAKLGGDSATPKPVTQAPVSRVDTPAPLPADPPRKKSHFWLWVLLLGGVIAGGVWFMTRRSKQDDVERDARERALRQEQLKRVTEQLDGLRTLKVDVRLSDKPAVKALLPEVEAIEQQLVGLAGRLSSASVPQIELDQVDHRLRKVRALLAGDEAALAAIEREEQYSGYTPPDRAPSAGPNYPPPGQGYPPNAPYPYPPQQAPVIIEQGGGGLGSVLTGVAIGSMLGGGHREVIHEREIVHDRVRDDGPPRDSNRGVDDWYARDDANSSSSSSNRVDTSDFDTGNSSGGSSDWDSGSSDDSSSFFDSGSSDSGGGSDDW